MHSLWHFPNHCVDVSHYSARRFTRERICSRTWGATGWLWLLFVQSMASHQLGWMKLNECLRNRQPTGAKVHFPHPHLNRCVRVLLQIVGGGTQYGRVFCSFSIKWPTWQRRRDFALLPRKDCADHLEEAYEDTMQMKLGGSNAAKKQGLTRHESGPAEMTSLPKDSTEQKTHTYVRERTTSWMALSGLPRSRRVGRHIGHV